MFLIMAKQTASPLTEANRRNSAADMTLIQQLHDTAVALGADCSRPEMMTEAARRNSAADAARIQAAHDTAVALGADCDDDNVPGVTQMLMREAKFTLASTQLDMPEEIRKLVAEYQDGWIPKLNLHEYGFEKEPHITVFYGIEPDTLPQIRQIAAEFPPIEVTLGKMSLFQNDDFDVLKVEVDSPTLRALHRRIRQSVPHRNERLVYSPHMTIAYLLPGRGEAFADGSRHWPETMSFKGRKVTVSLLQFSDPDGRKTPIPLTGKTSEAWHGASAKGKRCVKDVMAQGKDLSAAIAICRSSLGEALPVKYQAIDFTPPEAVQKAALRGLALRRKYGRGGLTTQQAGEQGIGSGVARAATLAKGTAVSPDTIRQMVAFFSRHEQHKDTPPEEGNGRIAWLLWGGDAGRAWATAVLRRMDAADSKAEAVARGMA